MDKLEDVQIRIGEKIIKDMEILTCGERLEKLNTENLSRLKL